MEYTKEFNKVMKFYRNTTPKQKLMFIDLISDKLTFYSDKGEKHFFDVDEEYNTNFNGTFYQINIK
jgi:hypothetical protein|tara:strand:- start:114 stop:311 length:198 start_codon:yes stop_codon:yes gene_type:complete